ncbi:MAG: hypothetical protein ACRDTD_20085, partial [Pseudonocardiaceae bacterium]
AVVMSFLTLVGTLVSWLSASGGALAGLMVVVASLSGCIAPDVEVIGALGVTVDEEQRPVVVVEASAP